MTNREWLDGLRHINDEIKELQSIQKDEKNLTISKDLDKLIVERTILYHNILDALSKVENPIYRRILIKRYLRNKDMKRIAYEMHYSYEYMYEMLKKAEAEIEQPKKS